MMESKKKVKVKLIRTCVYHLEKELSNDDFECLKQYEGNAGELGSDVISLMGKDPSEEPDSWNDEVEIEEVE